MTRGLTVMTTLTAAVLAIDGVTKVYRMGEVEVHALRGVDLALSAGELVALIGPSGSGKSTLLNILGGLDVPTSGHVRYRDEELTAGDDKALTAYRREHVGFVFSVLQPRPHADGSRKCRAGD